MIATLPLAHASRRLRLGLRPRHYLSAADTAKGAEFQRRKTHCPAGHAYRDENLYVGTDGSRACRACRAARDRAYKLNNREALRLYQARRRARVQAG
jgi:hypothetical protein